MYFFETVQNELLTLISNGLELKGYDISGKSYFVKRLDTVSNPDSSDIFNTQGISAQKGGVFISYKGSKQNTKGNKTITDTHEFLILVFIKIGTQNKLTELYNMIEDIKSIIYTNRFNGNKNADILECVPVPIPSQGNKSIYYGYIAISLENVYLPT